MEPNANIYRCISYETPQVLTQDEFIKKALESFPKKDIESVIIAMSFYEEKGFSSLGQDLSCLFGHVDILFEKQDLFGVYMLNVKPGGVIPLHYHKTMVEWEQIQTSGGLLLSGMSYPQGSVFSWGQGVAHGYINPTPKIQKVLCIDIPTFSPEEEIPCSLFSSIPYFWSI